MKFFQFTVSFRFHWDLFCIRIPKYHYGNCVIARSIHGKKLLIRMKPSGTPRAHLPRNPRPQDVIPIILLSNTNAPPESPLQTPCPSFPENAQMVCQSCTGAGRLPSAKNRARQLALVNVNILTNFNPRILSCRTKISISVK